MTQSKAFTTFLTVSVLIHGFLIALLGLYPWKVEVPDKPLKVRIMPDNAAMPPPLPPGVVVPVLPMPKVQPPPPVPPPPEKKEKSQAKETPQPRPSLRDIPRTRERFKPKIEEDEAPLDKRRRYSNLPTGEGGKEFGMKGKGAGTGDGEGKGVGVGKETGDERKGGQEELRASKGTKQEGVRPGLGGTKEKSLRDMANSVDKYIDPKSLEKGSGGGLRGGGQGGRVSILNPGFRYSSYLAKFVDKVEGVFQYRNKEILKRDGVALVKLLRNGELAELKLLQSSGSQGFDEAALVALKRAAPYAPFPPKWEDEELFIEVIFY